MFDKDYKITGKHANYWKDLCVLPGNASDKDREQHGNFKIFSTYIDAYILCPLIGYQYSRKGEIDNNVEANAGMLAEVIIKKKSELKFVYQIIMLADEESEPEPEKRVFRATTFSEDTDNEKKFLNDNMKIFNSYFLGGLEVLHEQFVDQCIYEDEYLKKMLDYVEQFALEQDSEALKQEIDKILNR